MHVLGIHTPLFKYSALIAYLLSIMSKQEREAELAKETKRQQENEDLRRIFARQANAFYGWLSDARYVVCHTISSEYMP